MSVPFTSLAAGLVIAAVFYGDIWIGITLPLAVVLMPLVAVSAGVRPFPMAPAGWLVVGMAVIVLVQSLAGFPPRGKSDLVVYLPFVYAGLALCIFSHVPISASLFVKASIIGAAACGALMVSTMVFAPDDFIWIPGQAMPTAEELFGSNKDRFSTPSDPISAILYSIKSGARNALGLSNYIAVFMVIAFVIALFSPFRWLGVIFAALTLVTLSRAGALFLLIAFAIWLSSRWIRLPISLSLLVLGMAGICVALFELGPWIEQYPQLASVTIRLRYWESALPLLTSSEALGSPRSYLADRIGAPIYWNPHNSFLHIWALFGALGVTFYFTYLALAVRSIWTASLRDPLWTGVTVAIVLAIAWSLIEPISITPAFEILVAIAYGATWNLSQRMSREPNVDTRTQHHEFQL